MNSTLGQATFRPQTGALAKKRVALLVLQDSSFYAGTALGATKRALGELVFNTSMTGYQEALTDPSYAGQILTFCYPLIGNYSFSPESFESAKMHARAAVVAESCQKPFLQSPAHAGTLGDFLASQNAPGIAGVDTRSIVLRIREHGALPCALQTFEEGELRDHADLAQAAAELAKTATAFDYSKENFVEEVSQKTVRTVGSRDAKKHVVLVDCGAKKSIEHSLARLGARVTIVPWDYSAKKILELEPDGVLFSNGPGNPALLSKPIQCCRELLGKKPVFGICLGNQILGHALGANTFKLKFGHRGSNHPVMHADSKRVFITAQNHGFAVQNLPPGVEPLFENCYDGTNEGIKCADKAAFSVQFHPEANPGPYDTSFLFEEFLEML
ncbi:MAG: glutamine-hydrolyzing carbamoyl-phosphate synthase small subunit [Candidatus Micrarchaeia archaeon]|jgi:carbamoyl-phosphate synthase small subunit